MVAELEEGRLFVTKDRYLEAIGTPMDLAVSRNKRYGNSIDIMKTPSILDLCLMKLVRTRELSEHDDKYEDEITDCINYLVYVKMRRAAERKRQEEVK